MQKFQANISSDVLLEFSRPGGPLYAQLVTALRDGIRRGRLAAGSTLPPSRALAAELGCSRWVVTEAYAQLAAEGYLAATAGAGTQVRPLEQQAVRHPRQPAEPPAEVVASRGHDMSPGLPDLRAFPMRQWMSAVRGAAASMAATDLGYPDRAGHPLLREVLAEYLARVRGAQADPADLVITSGAADAIGLICRVLGMHGRPLVAVEDPGWHRVREVVTASGLRIFPIPVDDQGLRPDLLHAQHDIRAVIVTPAHQFPSGVVLSAQRRAALLDWARAADALIIEDDYDAEYRYDRRPVGSLQGTGPASVALVGSVSKTVSPALSIGWMAVPSAWAQLVGDAIVHPNGPPVIDQLAFAAFVRTGRYDRHLRTARIRYRTRRDRIVAALADQLPDCSIAGIAAGLHLLMHLPAGTDAATVVRRASAAGVRVANLDTYRVQAIPDRPGLVLGYGNLADHQVDDAVSRLASVVRAA